MVWLYGYFHNIGYIGTFYLNFFFSTSMLINFLFIVGLFDLFMAWPFVNTGAEYLDFGLLFRKAMNTAAGYFVNVIYCVLILKYMVCSR